jgi:hypothetical protein
MSKLYFCVFTCIALVAGFGASVSAIELITDPHVQTGFNMIAPPDGQWVVEGPLQYTTAFGAPQWSLGQWNSKGTLYGATPIQVDGAYWFQNSYKTVVMGPTTTGYADVQLGINSIAEYNNVYRNSSQPWPALLASQAISTPGDGWLGTAAPSIAQMTSLNFNMDVNLLKADNIYRTGYSPGIHASQFNNYLTIQNLNPSSSGFGKYLWFGIGVYDDRATVTHNGSLMDQQTQSLIYSLGLGTFGKTQGPQAGDWMNINGDLLPYIKDALNYAWSHGILTDSKDYADYKIGGEYFGWEVPGLGDVNMQIKGLSLNATLTPEPGTLALLATGIVGLMAYAWHKRTTGRVLT